MMWIVMLWLSIADILKTIKMHKLEDELEDVKEDLISVVKQTENHLNKFNEKIYKMEKGEK